MKFMNSLFTSLSAKKIKASVNNSNQPSVKEDKVFKDKDSYFQLASSWADDYYTTVLASRNRYRLGLMISAGVCSLLLICVMGLSHTHEYIPLLVHHYDSGAVSVVPAEQHYAPESQAEVESELVRYMINRESYDPASFAETYQLVNLMSDSSVARAYHLQQSEENPHAFIQSLGNKTIRTIKIEGVNFLDNESENEKDKHHHDHKNLAEVNFIVTDKNAQSGSEKRTPYVAMISWTHTGIPEDPDSRWLNWNGFMVTSYTVNQRSL